MSSLPQHPASSESATPEPVCCDFGRSLKRLTLPLLVIITASSALTAAYFAGQASRPGDDSNLSIESLPALDATAAVTSEKFSMATGHVSEDAEGLFLLDHNSGLLQCSVIYPRIGQFMGLFTINVADALGTGGKGGQYMMVTGRAEFPRKTVVES